MDLFVICDKIESGDDTQINRLLSYPENEKMKFLGLLEEVALYAEMSEVDKEYAVYLFQWHFTFVFKSGKISKAFWSNLGGEEINKPYWKKSKDFSKYCN